MWEAIKNYINSKAYRCEHNWQQLDEVHVYTDNDSIRPHTIKRVFVCSKCCNSKIIKT